MLRGIEDVQGGAGADRLIGDDRANTLEGLGGGDRLDGGGGDDTLQGGGDLWSEERVGTGVYGSPVFTTAGDHVVGGGGDDTLASAGRQSSGGAGEDTCAGGGTRRRPQRLRGCEWWLPLRGFNEGSRIATDLRFESGELLVMGAGVVALSVALARDPATVLAEEDHHRPTQGPDAAAADTRRHGHIRKRAAPRRRAAQLLETRLGDPAAALTLRDALAIAHPLGPLGSRGYRRQPGPGSEHLRPRARERAQRPRRANAARTARRSASRAAPDPVGYSPRSRVS